MSSSAVAVAQAKSTPVKQISMPSVVQDSPGNWKHPKLAEITRRQNKNIFSEKNIRQIIYNVGALVALGMVRHVLQPLVPAGFFPKEFKQYSGWVYAALFLIPLINIGFALLPLVRPQDDLSDIALTPAQRQLLGLPPSSRPATPNSVYNTPPRYSRTPSLAGSPASIKSYASSPMSNLGSPASGQYSSPRPGLSPSKLNAGQYSPSVSPLLQRAVGGGMNGARGSFGSPSPLNTSTASSVFSEGPGTPTPGGKRSSVSLNNKWLYEKGRRNSGNNWLHQNMS
ncbi:hypothetical protein N0V88_001378 [Collariella sp. IMI 366227]|nr:hypothetical protein N0V88_001378 [Collariella sp. IMI 366227]